MQFLIADTFTQSLGALTEGEQRAAKLTVLDLQLNPEQPGLSLHKLDKARDKNFWSARVDSDIRVILHRTPGSLLVCYVDHHDRAYAWAEKRKLETHPKTGAAQFVEIRETVQEIIVPRYVEAPEPVRATQAVTTPLFAKYTDDDLLGLGVPSEWLADVRTVVSDDEILELATHLPGEAGEALLDLATTGVLPQRVPVAVPENPFAHPDAQRRFQLVTSSDELRAALEYPWEKWSVFLHPDQRALVERRFNGPARVTGSAGTGKTIVALHRAAALARRSDGARVLLTTFSEVLARSLRAKLRILLNAEPRVVERIDVEAIDAVGERLHRAMIGPATLVNREVLLAMLWEAQAAETAVSFKPGFVVAEWDQLIDPWNVTSWEAYRAVPRLGRKTRLSDEQRAAMWRIAERVLSGLRAVGLQTRAQVFGALAESISASGRCPYDAVVVDEAQDVGVAHLRFFAALGAGMGDSLFFAGDLGQRIFQVPFSWKALGVDIRGRSRTLKVNYRTSQQIRRQADRLLDASLTDVDGNTEGRTGTFSVFSGPPPEVHGFADSDSETSAVAAWLRERVEEGCSARELAVFVRSEAELPRAKASVAGSGLEFAELDPGAPLDIAAVTIGTMHTAKGLEFRGVVVMACDEEVVPLQSRIESVADAADLDEVYATERHLLYVACTRARERLWVSGVQPMSEFVTDMQA